MTEGKKIVSGLKERFLEGEKLTVAEIVEEYLSPKTAYNYLIATKKVKGYLSSIKKSFRAKDGVWFGCLDMDRHFGVATTVDEVRFAVISYYKQVKGNMVSARLLIRNARADGILPSGMKQEHLLLANYV